MTRTHAFAALLAIALASGHPAAAAEPDHRRQALDAMRRATAFYHGQVSSHGGYVYKYSDDLAKREGEGKTGPDTVWVQPPGTPAVGMAYLDAYERTGEAYLLDAAKAAGDCLARGQLRSGGWTNSIEFDPAARAKFAYRVDPPAGKKKNPFNVSTFDDDKTQSAVRFMARLDKAMGFKDAAVHEAATVALDSILKAQFPNGAWSQGWDEFPDPAKHPVKPASFPDDWPRKYPGGKYWFLYTFNDNSIADTIETLLLASKVYDDPRYRQSALKAGDFILLAQLPDPQPAWAQQYDYDMRPAWARKFEPPAVSGGESQGLLQVLMQLYAETGDAKYLKPVPSALEYLRRSRLPDGRLARFYELRTNKPLYFTKAYELTYGDNDLPTHYSFQVASRLDAIAKRYEELKRMTPEQLAAERSPPQKREKAGASLEGEVKAVIAALDGRGAWVEDGKLKYQGGNDPTRRVIDSRTFIRNLDTLSRYAAAAGK